MAMSDRWVAIMSYLKEHEEVTVEELMEAFNASRSTVRRDLIAMEKQGLLQRTRGGAKLFMKQTMGSYGYTLDGLLEAHKAEKELIAKKAASLVQEGDIIFLDSGTTCYYIIDYITAKDVTVVTNGIMHINKLMSRGIRTYILNGYAVPENNLIIAEDTYEKVERMNFSIAFIGSMGIHASGGYTTTTSIDGKLKAAVIKAAEKCYVVADHSKMNKRQFYTYGYFDEAPLITDQEIPFEHEALQVIYT